MDNLNNQTPNDQATWTNEQLAQQLGITIEDLQSCSWTIEKETGDNDTVYNYYVRFAENAPKSILQKITGIDKGNRVLIKANYEDDTF
ncbi:hypothetical protein ACTHGU_21600 [Chitinophagaceae bacterium MMS25-I14]